VTHAIVEWNQMEGQIDGRIDSIHCGVVYLREEGREFILKIRAVSEEEEEGKGEEWDHV
jgi:hypothetical protein